MKRNTRHKSSKSPEFADKPRAGKRKEYKKAKERQWDWRLALSEEVKN